MPAVRTLEEQTNSLAAYLPQGRAWAAKHIQTSVTRGLLEGLSGELLRSAALIAEFREEILPDRTTLFVDEWERAVGIPDACFTGVGSIEQRRNDVLAKLTSLGVQTAEDMRLLALQVYGINLTIVNPERDPDNVFPYTFEPTGEADPLGTGGEFKFNLSDRQARFQIIIRYDNLPKAVLFPYVFPIPFLTREIAVIECLFAQLRPANVGFTNEIPIATESPVPPPIPPVEATSGVSLEFNTADVNIGLFTGTAVGDDTKFDFGIPNNTTGAFTIAVWAKPITTSTAATIIALGDGPSGSDNRMWITQNTATGIITVDIETPSGDIKRWLTPAGLVPIFGSDKWFHFAATYAGSDDLRLYFDGTRIADGDITKSVDDSFSPEFTKINIFGSLGGNKSTDLQPGEHRIYTAATWDVDLSAAEVTAIFNERDPAVFDLLQNTGGYTSAVSLQSWWRPGALLTGLDGPPPSALGQDFGPIGADFDHEEIVDDDDVTDDFPQPTFTPQLRSILFSGPEGAGEFNQASSAAAGIIGTWSIAFWCKSDTDGDGLDAAFAIRHTANRNSIELTTVDGSTNFRFFITDDAAASRQEGTWAGVFEGASVDAPWKHIVLTWDGTISGLTLYVDGVDQGAPDVHTANLDDTGIVDSASRDIHVGGRLSGSGSQWQGPIYSVGIYDSELAQAEVTVLYNGGNGRDFDVEENSGAYVSANDLIHLYRLGLSATTPSEFGKDYIGSSDLTGTGPIDEPWLVTDIPS